MSFGQNISFVKYWHFTLFDKTNEGLDVKTKFYDFAPFGEDIA